MVNTKEARNKNPNTSAASLAERKVSEAPPATVLTVASIVIKAKTIIHPSIINLHSGTAESGCPTNIKHL